MSVYPSFFMSKFKHKEMILMLKDEVLEKIFANKEMKIIPLGCQSTAVNALEQVLEELKEENSYAGLSELFSTTDE